MDVLVLLLQPSSQVNCRRRFANATFLVQYSYQQCSNAAAIDRRYRPRLAFASPLPWSLTSVAGTELSRGSSQRQALRERAN